MSPNNYRLILLLAIAAGLVWWCARTASTEPAKTAAAKAERGYGPPLLSQIESPRLAPVAAHDADPDAPASAGQDPEASVSINDFAPQGFIMVHEGTELRSLGTAFSPGNNGAAPTEIKGLSIPIPGLFLPQSIPTLPGSIPGAEDDGDGTLTFTLPDGSTRTIVNPITTNDDGTSTLTWPDGTTQAIYGIRVVPPAANPP